MIILSKSGVWFTYNLNFFPLYRYLLDTEF